jgi:4-alpha-glucanotransferase
VAQWAILPMQEALGLGSEARTNTPALPNGNWGWRMRVEAIAREAAERLQAMIQVTGRAGNR